MLTAKAKWNLNGELVGPDYVGLPSFWPFYCEVLQREVNAAVNAARKLEAFEHPEAYPL